MASYDVKGVRQKQSNTLLNASFIGASYLIGLQFFSRILTFGMNQLILRYTSPALFGFATIQLELLMITILFLCREGTRLALQRQAIIPREQKPKRSEIGAGVRLQNIVNLSFLPIAAGVFLSSLGGIAYIHLANEETSALPYFQETVLIYLISTVLELFSEPFYNVVQHLLLYRIRAASEGSAVLTRCLITFAFSLAAVKYGRIEDYGALPFALGQLGYSIVLLVLYWSKVSKERTKTQSSFSFYPKKGQNSRFFDISYLKLAMTITGQSILKHFLTEGDRIMISWYSTNYEQGIYSLAANYGSLIARILLQPVEEASRNLFGKLLASQEGRKNHETEGSSGEANDRWKHDTQLAGTILIAVTRFYLILGIFVALFGPVYSAPLLQAVVGKQWAADTPAVLATYCYYIPFLAVNGIMEAFVQATATPAQLQQQSLWMIAFSGLYYVAGWSFMYHWKLGAQGLIYANITNLTARIAWASTFVYSYFFTSGVAMRFGNCMPSRSFLAMGSISYMAVAIFNSATIDVAPIRGLRGLLHVFAGIVVHLMPLLSTL